MQLTKYQHSDCNRTQVAGWGIQKGGGVTVSSCFQNNSYYVIKKGWSVDLVDISSFLVIYLTTIEDYYISIPFDLAIFSIQWIKSVVEVPTDVFLRIKYRVKLSWFLICTVYCTHAYANVAKSVSTFKIGIIPLVKVCIFQRQI